MVLVGISTQDRPGLLLDISKSLLGLGLQLRHTEAAVLDVRSVSIWRCEVIGSDLPDVEQTWSVLNAMLEIDTGADAIKKRGLRVVRAIVTKTSSLIGKTTAEVNFRGTYKAAIVAIQHQGKNVSAEARSTFQFNADDIVILQASDKSPLLVEPPTDFYKRKQSESDHSMSSKTTNPVSGFVKSFTSRLSRENLHEVSAPGNNDNINNDATALQEVKRTASQESNQNEKEGFEFYIPEGEGDDLEENPLDISETNISVAFSRERTEAAWKDLQVMLVDDDNSADLGGNQREFLTAMTIAEGSEFEGKTASKAGLAKLSGVFLVSIERPVASDVVPTKSKKKTISVPPGSDQMSVGTGGEKSLLLEQRFNTIDPDEGLQAGDVLWFSGSASAVGDLRKIPGLVSFDNDQVEKINEKIHDRRLVQAVVARKGPLVGKTVREVRFRTRYGAAVISVHREGKRVHDHPGQVRLQAGDVLLLEAGPTFIERNNDNDRSFALLAEVDGSAPPRLSKFVPALLLTVIMLAVTTAGVASLLVCALVASIFMVVTGILSQQEARDAINWEVFVTIASAFGIGTALENSGVAGGIANGLVALGEALGIGDAGLFGAVYFATFLISNVVTNNAAAALIFPISMQAAEETGADRLLMAYTLMLGASASFMSPFGYTTNLLIYGPGGYKYRDFVYVGSPMQIVLWILSIALLSSASLWYLSWLITAAIFTIVVVVRLTNGSIASNLGGKLKMNASKESNDQK